MFRIRNIIPKFPNDCDNTIDPAKKNNKENLIDKGAAFILEK